MRQLVVCSVISAALVLACHSAGPYGHARSYKSLDDEEAAAKGSVDYDPVMVKRSPEQFRGKPLSVFGVVTARSEGPGGTVDVKLSIRTLEIRNLCETSAEDSCRVTVSDREHGIVHALVPLRTEDAIGQRSVGPGSLLRLIGSLRDGAHTSDGEPVLRATYYRHWPRNFYVTTASRAYMKQ